MKRKRFNKTEESIFTLLSLKVLIEQAFESIHGQEDILNSEFDRHNYSFHNLVTDTIHEALRYQILLKTCAFLDEWNKVFGVTTDLKDAEKIKVIKKIAKPAYKQINQWKELRDFRNEAIAHNHRDKQGNNIYLTSKSYDFPDTVGEIYLIVFCADIMLRVVSFFFEDETKTIVEKIDSQKKGKKRKRMSTKAVKLKAKEIRALISEPLNQILMHSHLLNAIALANEDS